MAEIGDASWERPAGHHAWSRRERMLERGFLLLLVVVQVAWIGGLIALGLWLA